MILPLIDTWEQDYQAQISLNVKKSKIKRTFFKMSSLN